MEHLSASFRCRT